MKIYHNKHYKKVNMLTKYHKRYYEKVNYFNKHNKKPSRWTIYLIEWFFETWQGLEFFSFLIWWPWLKPSRWYVWLFQRWDEPSVSMPVEVLWTSLLNFLFVVFYVVWNDKFQEKLWQNKSTMLLRMFYEFYHIRGFLYNV